jgi:hypothetical protein
VSINYSDLPPDGQIQAAKEAGIQLNPAGVIMQEVQKQAKPAQEPVNA